MILLNAMPSHAIYNLYKSGDFSFDVHGEINTYGQKIAKNIPTFIQKQAGQVLTMTTKPSPKVLMSKEVIAVYAWGKIQVLLGRSFVHLEN